MDPSIRSQSRRGSPPVRCLPFPLLLLLLLAAAPLTPAATLTTVNDLTGAAEDTPFTISYATIAANADEGADTVAFQLISVEPGTSLTQGGSAVTPGSRLASGQSWVWQGALNDNGTLDAFKIRAWDGTNVSGSDEQVRVVVAPVNDPPTISAIGNQNVDEDNSKDVNFTVADVDDSTSSITVRGTSGNQTRLPDANITFPDNSGSSRRVRLAPAADQNGPVTVTLWADDGSATNSLSFTLTINAVNDAPELTSVATLSPATEDTPFTITYAMLNAAAASSDIDGPFPLSFRIESIDNGSVTQGMAAVTLGSSRLTSTSDPWIWTPVDNVSGLVNAFKIVAYDGSLPSSPARQVQVDVAPVPDAPSVSASTSPATIVENQDVFPFQLQIGDSELNNTPYTVYIETTAGTTNFNFTFGTIDPVGPYIGTRAQVQQQVQSVRYRAGGTVVGEQTERFLFRVIDSIGGVGTDIATLTILGVNDPPQINGVSPLIFATDEPDVLVQPFAAVQIGDPDVGQQLTVTITLNDPTAGVLSTNQVVGTDRAVIDTLVRAITFKPNRRGASATVTLTITVNDGIVSRSNNETQISITTVNNPPQILGISTNQPVAVSPSDPRPFKSLTLRDEDTNALTVTVSLDNAAKGSFTNLAGFTDLGLGIYRITAEPGAATLALRSLAFAPSPAFPFPPNAPGGTTFTLQVEDFSSLRAEATLSIELREELRNHLVTDDTDEDDPLEPGRPKKGTLRRAIAEANTGDVITFALAQYPALIRLNRALVLDKNLAIKGPGADLLTLSGDTDGNLEPDTQIFRVQAAAAIEGLTLTHGAATQGIDLTGGAIYVGPGGALLLRFCAVTDSQADQWGGGIDVDQGSLRMEQCLLSGNVTDETAGLGGGAVSLYTDQPCAFINTTFSGNRQLSPGGFGGGALYAENYTASTPLLVEVTHCTFADNDDVSGQGSSIHAKVFGTGIQLQNSIFADGRGRNLEVNGAARIMSQGGNLSDDEATSNLNQGGQANTIVFLDQFSDLRAVDPMLLPLDAGRRPTPGHPLQPGSPALDWAVPTSVAIDQRGVFRGSAPDAGALEFNATRRLVINEIHFDPAGGDSAFVELYVPRNSAAVNLTGYELWVDGTNRHTFAAGAVVGPGFGRIVAEGPVNASGSPVDQPVALGLGPIGLIEVRLPGPDGGVVASAVYASPFVDPDEPANLLAGVGNNSLTLGPQFRGFAYLPHAIAGDPPLGGARFTGGGLLDTSGQPNSPGKDSGEKIFGAPNSNPRAVDDLVLVGEDEWFVVPALANDLDADGLDWLVLAGVNPAAGGPANLPMAVTAKGALVDIYPTNANPLRGVRLAYDPRVAPGLQPLPEGARTTDEFYYTIADVGLGPIQALTGTAGAPPVTVAATNHGLANGDTVFIQGAAIAAYNGKHTVTVLDTNLFTIAQTFVGATAVQDFEGTNGLAPAVVVSPNHGLADGARVQLSGAGTAEYNGKHVVTVLDANRFAIPVTYTGNPGVKGNWTPVAEGSWGKLAATGPIADYAATNGGSLVVVQSPNHRLTDGEQTFITGADVAAYNGQFAVTVIDADHFLIPVGYVTNSGAKGTWVTVDRRSPSALSEAKVTVTVLGANDPPTPMADGLATDEETILRVMADPDLAGSSTVFDTDVQYPMPRTISGVNLLFNDGDTDTDDDAATLKVVGVLGQVFAITNYAAYSDTNGNAFVRVESAAPHGLSDGAVILISGYGGHPSYNGFHAITVLEDTAFAIPTDFIDNAPVPGVWGLLTDPDRLEATSQQGADVRLEIRADRRETSVVYNPRASTNLNSLALNQVTNDLFYYAVEDSHGAVSVAPVTVQVTGVNDAPVPAADPDTLGQLGSVLGEQPFAAGVAQLGIDFYLPAGSGQAGRADVQAQFSNATETARFLLTDLWVTDEDTAVDILSTNLLANDADVDTRDVLRIKSAAGFSLQGAAVTLSPDGQTLNYNPAGSALLNALAREEAVIDTFEVTVTDDQGGDVPATVSVLVVGANDTPRAMPDWAETFRNELLVLGPPPQTNSVTFNDEEDDINGAAPDNQLALVPVTNAPTTVPGASVTIVSNTLTYDPVPAEFFDLLGPTETHEDTFDYTVMDGSFIFANDDLFKVEADGAGYNLNVLYNDRNLTGAGGALTIVAVGEPNRRGTVTTNAAGTELIYTPEVNFVGDEVFSYTVADENGLTDRGLVTVRVTVNQLNGNLQANDDYFTAAAGESPVLDVLANDNILPASGETLAITRVVTLPDEGGSFDLISNQLTYTPAVGFVGTERFSYEISGGGTARAIAHVTVLVIDRTGTIATRNDTFTVPADSRDNSLDVLANDEILPGATEFLTIREWTSPAHGSLSLADGNALLLYSPNAGFVGQDNFTYVATDGVGGTGTGRVAVTVGSLTTSSDFFTVPLDTNGLPVELDVLANDGVGAGGPGTNITIVNVTPMLSPIGAMNVAGGTRLQFGPTLAVGEQTFTYTISDGAERTARGEVTVVVVEKGVRANPDFLSVLVDSADNPLPVLANDAAIPDLGRRLTVVRVGTGVDAPNHGGTVVVTGTNLIYTPAPGFSGEETFTYTMTDSRESDTAKVVVRVTPGELRANDDTFTVFYELPASSPSTFSSDGIVELKALAGRLKAAADSVSQYLTNRLAPNTLTLLAAYADEPTNALLSSALIADLNAVVQGETIYDPARFAGVPLSLQTTNLLAQSPQGTGLARLNRLLLQDAYPTELARLQPRAFTLPVLANDRVLPDLGQLLSITAVGIVTNAPSQQGTVTISADGASLTYVPRDNFGFSNYVERFTYEISDGTARRAQAVVTVQVEERTNVRRLETRADAFTLASDSQNNVLAVLANDNVKPATADGWSITGILEAPTNGVAVISGSTVLYTPQAGFVGTDQFVYAVSDGLGGTGEAAVTVKVGDLPLCPDWFTAISGSLFNEFDVLANDAIRPATSADYTLLDAGGADRNGTLLLREGKVLYSPDPQAAGPFPYVENFWYRVVDDSMGTVTSTAAVTVYERDSDRDTATLHITVRGINDPPVITGTVAGQRVYHGASLRPFAGVTIHELDNQRLQPLVITVSLDDPARGLLVPTGGFVDAGGGVYRLGSAGAGVTAAAGTSAIRMLQFWPTADGRVSPGAPEITQFTISVDDGFAPPVTDDTTTVLAEHAFRDNLLAADGLSGDLLGSSVAATRDMVVIGAPVGLHNGVRSGVVYVYARNAPGYDSWTLVKKLVPTGTISSDLFGNAVAISGDTIVVGSVTDSENGRRSGTAYVFERNQGGADQWGLVKKFLPADGRSDDQFGIAVAIDQDTVVVGSHFDDDLGGNSGSAYVFGRDQGGANQWGLVKKLLPDDGSSSDEFGIAVAVHRETIVVGAWLDDPTGANSGAAYVFERNQDGADQWGQTKKLIAADGAAGDEFGFATAIEADTIVVNARQDDDQGLNSGSVYIFQRDQDGLGQWGQVTKLLPADGAAGDEFGFAVSIHEGVVAAGAPQHDERGLNSGAVYVFRPDRLTPGQWEQIDKLVPNTDTPGAEFGSAVSLYRKTLAVGARSDDQLAANAGSAYIFRLRYNNAPQVIYPIPDQDTVANQPFSLVLPVDTFADPDIENALTLTAGPPPLPAWLSFDPLAALFSGTPTAVGVHPVWVRATDDENASATSEFDISVWPYPASVGNTNAPGIQPDLAMTTTGSGPTQIAFQRLQSDGQLNFVLLISTDLVHWLPADLVIDTQWVAPVDDTTETVTIQLLNLPSVLNPLFYRLVVQP